MKKRKRFRTLALAAAMAMIFTGQGARAEAPASAETPVFTLPTGDAAAREPLDKLKKITASEAAEIEASMKSYVPAEHSLIQNSSDHFYYYEQLDPIAKEIYDVMLMIAKDPSAEGNYGVMMTDMDPESDEYYYEMLCAYFAMTYDHPELFWLYCGSETTITFCSEVMSMNGIYLVYYYLVQPFAEYERQMTAFNNAAEQFLAQIDTSASDYEIVRQVHDKLIDLVTYDDAVLADMEGQGRNLAHTAYGALVADSEGLPNYAVCDGYSLAFEYLLQQCGIEAVVLGGDAGSNENDLGGHAWNMVKLDGMWYEVDSTWDDAGGWYRRLSPEMEGYGYYIEALENPPYLDKIQHYLFLRSTDVFRHFIPDESYKYYSADGQWWVMLVGEGVHIRYDSDGTVDPYNADPSVISLAPLATASY